MPPKPHIFITHEFYPRRGGIATYVEEMAIAAAKLGLDVEVWAQAAPAETTEKDLPFRLRRLPLVGTHDFVCQLRLARQLVRHRRKLRHATVYLVEPGPMLALMWLQFLHAFRPKQILLTFHGSEILRFAQRPWIRPLARRLIRHADRISTLTGYTESLLLTHFPEAAGKVVRTPGALRSNFAIRPHIAKTPTDKIIVLTVGRLHPRKGQLQTLTALAALPTELRSRVEYWLVGTASKGNYEEQLSRLAASANLHVRFFGDVPDDKLGSIYAQADIFALTSIEHGSSIEGFGLVYLEAAAHGLPSIAHDVGGVSEAVLRDQTGLLISSDNPTGLTAAFATLIIDAALRERLGAAGRAWAAQHSWGKSAALLFRLPSPDLNA